MPSFPRKIFSYITWFNLATGLLLLMMQWKSGSIPSSLQMGYFLLLIGGTGIPHGALDHIIAKNNVERKAAFNIPRFLGKYVFAILAYSVCWIYLPSISLAIFLLISAWHFGETDLSDIQANKILVNTARLIWGIFVLMLILLTHEQDAFSVIERITGKHPSAATVWQFFITYKWILLTTCGLFSGSFIIADIFRQRNMNSFLRSTNLFLILIICSQLPLLPSFALYFGGWHAICSFEITFKFLHQQKEETATNPLTLWKNALPMTFLAAFGFVFMAYIWTGLGIKSDPIPALFIFLSIITLPHLDVMDKLIRSEKSTKA